VLPSRVAPGGQQVVRVAQAADAARGLDDEPVELVAQQLDVERRGRLRRQAGRRDGRIDARRLEDARGQPDARSSRYAVSTTPRTTVGRRPEATVRSRAARTMAPARRGRR
jgi:hypothetical protein